MSLWLIGSTYKDLISLYTLQVNSIHVKKLNKVKACNVCIVIYCTLKYLVAIISLL